MRVLRPRKRNGAAAIEFALVAVVFLFLVFAIIDWSWVLFDQVNVENAASAAARAGALSDTPATTARSVAASRLSSYGLDPTTAEITTLIRGTAPYAQLDVTIHVPYSAPVPWAALPVPNAVLATSTAHLEVQ